MAKANDYTDILVRKKILSADQLSEARDLAMRTGVKLQDALIRSNYASPGEVMEALAEFHGMSFVDLSNVEIPKAVIELMPDAVAHMMAALDAVRRRATVFQLTDEDVLIIDKAALARSLISASHRGAAGRVQEAAGRDRVRGA